MDLHETFTRGVIQTKEQSIIIRGKTAIDNWDQEWQEIMTHSQSMFLKLEETTIERLSKEGSKLP